MRNSSVSALINEFLFDIYRMMDIEGDEQIPNDIRRIAPKIFCHKHMSFWEWSTDALASAGVIKIIDLKTEPGSRMNSPYSYPLMTLDECLSTDFSRLETFDNYCYAMFTFSMMNQISSSGEIFLSDLSPRFIDEIAAKDDIFLVEGPRNVRFKQDRFKEKVMTRWDEMDVRRFKGKEDA